MFFAFSGRDSFSFFAPQLTLTGVRHVGLDLLVLEQTTDRLPQAAIPLEVPLQVYEATPRLAERRIDVGDPADDTFFNISGFHGPERGGPLDGPAGSAVRVRTGRPDRGVQRLQPALGRPIGRLA